ncbi:MAG TPA: enoyl-CoA hydratase [Actinobacteria bacterium]|nr:enoyl-CoA hydratase [Actinomycetota bacterium]
MASSVVTTVDAATGVAVVQLDRPPLNALDRQMQEDLRETFTALGEDSAVRAIVVRGNERAFAAGADVKEMAHWTDADIRREGPQIEACFTAVARTPQPVIAAVRGYALGGGCELALFADIRIAGESSVFGQPEILLGIIPGAGGTQRLARLIGASRAKDLIFTGRSVAAGEALSMGLVNEVVADGAVVERAMELASVLATRPAVALRRAKRAIDEGLDADLTAGLVGEAEAFADLFATHDRRIGMDSFLAEGPGRAVFEHR